MYVDIRDKDVEIVRYATTPAGTDNHVNRIKYKDFYWYASFSAGIASWHQEFPSTDGCNDCTNLACKKCAAKYYHYQPPHSFQSNNLAFCTICRGTFPGLSEDESWRISYANQPCPDCAST